jgi:hypothetical protein
VGSAGCGGAATAVQQTLAAGGGGSDTTQVNATQLTQTGPTDQARSGADMSGMDMTQHAGHSDHIVTQRTAPADTGRAQRILQAAMSLLGKVRYEDTAPATPGKGKPVEPNGDHRKVPDSVKAEWKRLYPDLPVPNVIVYDKASHVAQGALFVGGKHTVDLGMGPQHQHEPGGAYMAHMWFIPGNLALAFSDVSQKDQARAAATAAMTQQAA